LSDRDDRRHPARSIVKDRLSVGAAALYHARSGFFKARLEAPDGGWPGKSPAERRPRMPALHRCAQKLAPIASQTDKIRIDYRSIKEVTKRANPARRLTSIVGGLPGA
jgi:hypothetical protein